MCVKRCEHVRRVLSPALFLSSIGFLLYRLAISNQVLAIEGSDGLCDLTG